jgi:hypothetical protein
LYARTFAVTVGQGPFCMQLATRGIARRDGLQSV